jgi:hypothetical protein
MAQLPDYFELPFSFQGDPVMSATINGDHCERCVLDTGAATTVIRTPSANVFGGLQIGDDTRARIESLIVNGVEFGPLVVKARVVPSLNAPEVYLGTTELKSHCLIMDYQRQVAIMRREPWAAPSMVGSPIQYVDGRPVVSTRIAGREMHFVLDTGSNANWLFHGAQTDEVMRAGILKEETDGIEAECGLGNIPIQRSLLLSNLTLGGGHNLTLNFYLGGEHGGPGAAKESGIIGTGQIASWHQGIQVIDFISGFFHLLPQTALERVRSEA